MTRKTTLSHRTCFSRKRTIISGPGPNHVRRKFMPTNSVRCSRHDFSIAHLSFISVLRSGDLLVAPAPCAKRLDRRRQLHLLRLGTSLVLAAAVGFHSC